MKKLLFLLLLIPFLGTSQGTFTAPVGYNTGAPTAAPSGVGTRWRFDLLTGKKYTWLPGSMAWDEDAAGIDQVSGCASPAYTPGYNQSNFAVNSCSTPELYQYYSSAWHCLNCGGGTNISAGSGITITGAAPDITISADDNSPTNELQTLSISGSDLTLSDGGGTVTLPGGSIAWPLLAPAGSSEAPSYSFEDAPQTGAFLDKGLKIKAQIGNDLNLLTAENPEGDSPNIFISTGAATDGSSGSILITIGESINGTGGGFRANAGDGTTQGGGFVLFAGNSSAGVGGNFDLTAGASGLGDGGNFNMAAGNSADANGGDINLTAGGGPTRDGRVVIASQGGLKNVAINTTARNALVGVDAGTTIFCTNATATDGSTGVLQTWNGSAWKNHW